MADALQFNGQITGVKQEVNKGGYGQSGALTLSLTIKQPSAPWRPEPDYVVYDNSKGEWNPRPADVKRKKNEADAPWEKRQNECRQAQAAHDRGMANYREASERFSREWAVYEQALKDYAWVSGFAGVLGAQEVEVSIAPLNRQFLTFERPALIPLPAVTSSPAGNSEDHAAEEEAPEPGDRESPASAPNESVTVVVGEDGQADGPIIGDGGVLLCPGCMHPCSQHDEPGAAFGGCAWADTEQGDICECDQMWKVEVSNAG